MTDQEWIFFLKASRETLGKGERVSWASDSWCAWTTFSSLENDLTYWHGGLPDLEDIGDYSVSDEGRVWSQSFKYSDMAHFIIPAVFSWEHISKEGGYKDGNKFQNRQVLSKSLNELDIQHRLTNKVLEVKLY